MCLYPERGTCLRATNGQCAGCDEDHNPQWTPKMKITLPLPTETWRHHHTKDEDCTVDPETGICQECGALTGECPECHGQRYHKPGCSQYEAS